MNPFSYERAVGTADAVSLASTHGSSKYLGGGTNLVDLMRVTIERPELLVDVANLPGEMDVGVDGSVLIGASVSNTTVAANVHVRRAFPVLSRAILAGASAQIRNMATVGGNVMQRTRCAYFYDQSQSCNKRQPGSGCGAREGFNRYHAILGASPSCVATHPSDMSVALAALDAIVHVEGPTGAKTIPITDFHRLPGERPDIETGLKANELIVAIEVPALPFSARSTYRKVRDRASYAFALVSVAAALDIDEDGIVRDVRLALGGVAHKPWRAFKTEASLRGEHADSESFRAAAEAELADAVGLKDNGFKIELARRTIVAVLNELKGEAA